MRFTVHSLRNASISPTSTPLSTADRASFGLLLDGCAVGDVVTTALAAPLLDLQAAQADGAGDDRADMLRQYLTPAGTGILEFNGIRSTCSHVTCRLGGVTCSLSSLPRGRMRRTCRS